MKHRDLRTRPLLAAPRTRPLLAALLALGCTGPALAGFPSPTYPTCGEDESLAGCPPDMLESDGVTWRGITWSFVSFIPPELQRQVRPEELALGSGNWLDKALQLTAGRYDVPIAVIDSGIRWRANQIAEKVLLNRGEMPAPQRANGATCVSDDCNGDGWFTVRDYADDARVNITFGADDADTQLDPSDLIEAFSDGLDNDGNGYVDDIAGWDFMWNNNDPRASNDFYHGSAVMTDAAATLGDPSSDVGYCPNCAILPVRVSDSFMGEGNKIAQGILYAVDRGARVIAIAMGGISNSEFLRDAYAYAYANDVTIVTAIGDELSYHHLPPGANEYAIPVHSIEFWPIYGLQFARSFLAYNGCNNYGAHLALVAATNDCATGSTAIISGIAGLVYSRGLDNGLELSADEVRAILTGSADDINVTESRLPDSPHFPSYPGWDQFFGYGRVNARHAVDLARPDRVPPEVRIHGPKWYQYIDPRETPEILIDAHLDAPRADGYSWTLEWAPGADARDGDFVKLTDGGGSSSQDGVLYRWPVAAIPKDKLDPAAPLEAISGADALVEKLEKVNAHAITVRLSVKDTNGNTAEHRKTFFVHEDPDLAAGFPRYLGPGESSPSIYDLNGDGRQEIVVGTSDGKVHAISGSGGELPGWPVQVGPMTATDPSNPANHLAAVPYRLDGVVPARQGILGNVAPTDLEGDGKAEVLVSTLDGWLYVFAHDGKVKPGFPVTRDPIDDDDTDVTHQFDPGMAAGPVPADLDGDGVQEIVLPAMDQKVYVWRYNGQRHPGFPVWLGTADSEAKSNQGRIYSTPAVGDIDGDGRPEIITGTNEYMEAAQWFTYVYAIHGDGTKNPDGPILRNWPVRLTALLSGVVNYMGEGYTGSPVLLDLEGDTTMEVAVAAPGWCPIVLNGKGREVAEMSCDASGWGEESDTDEVGGLTYLANITAGDIDLDGDPDLVAGLTCLNWGLSLLLNSFYPYQDHVVVAWDANTGKALDAWPRVIEDIQMFVKPAIDDISGDGWPEVITSSGGYAVHAWNADGIEAPGWPRFTGGWIYSAIRTGDITGDGKKEVVAISRGGYLYAWQTDGIEAARAGTKRAVSKRGTGKPERRATTPERRADTRPDRRQARAR